MKKILTTLIIILITQLITAQIDTSLMRAYTLEEIKKDTSFEHSYELFIKTEKEWMEKVLAQHRPPTTIVAGADTIRIMKKQSSASYYYLNVLDTQNFSNSHTIDSIWIVSNSGQILLSGLYKDTYELYDQMEMLQRSMNGEVMPIKMSADYVVNLRAIDKPIDEIETFVFTASQKLVIEFRVGRTSYKTAFKKVNSKWEKTTYDVSELRDPKKHYGNNYNGISSPYWNIGN